MKLRFLIPLVCGLLASCSSKPKPAPSGQVKAIVGATLIDGRGGEPVPDAVIVVDGNKIKAAGARSAVKIPDDALTLEAKGKFVIPGLIDLHVHLGSTGGPGFRPEDYTRDRIERNLRQYLYFGVTTVRSVGTERDAGFEVRKAQRDGQLFGSRLFTAGRGFTAKGGHPSQEIGDIARQPGTPEDARKQVGELAAQQADLVKIWVDSLHGRQPQVSQPIIDAIIEEAATHKIPVHAHIFSLADTRHMTEKGAAGFLHMVRDTEDLNPAFIELLKSHKIIFVPTLIRQELGWFYTSRGNLLRDPDLLKDFDPEVLNAIRTFTAGKQPDSTQQLEFDRAKRNSRKLASAGIPMGIGSDGGSSHDLPGIMTHREIEIFTEAGFSPSEAIQAATSNGALALGKLDQLGTIEPGKLADLLILNGNPLENIRNLRRIDRLMLDGGWVDRAMLP